MTHRFAFAAAATIALALCCVSAAFGQSPDGEALKSNVVAPPNMRSVDSTLGGAYFVDAALLDRYEALRARVVQVREEIAKGTASGEAALKTLEEIEQQSRALRAEIDKAKVLVSAFQVFSNTSEQTFPLGDERLVIITGDHVIVRGWEGPGIKCVVEKIIVAKEKPTEEQFAAIGVQHELTVAKDKVGLTREERDAEEQKFLESEDGRKLTGEQRARRKAFVDQIHHSYDDYLAFQGREANTIELKGLTFEEGNRNLTMRIESPGGGATMGSQWQRHATMTVFVPPCKALAIRGCQVGLDVQSIEGDLVLTTHGSRDRNYDGSFAVHGVKGNVTIRQAPVRLLTDVSGNVRFLATSEFVNSGTLHTNDTRTFTPYDTQPTRIERIGGELVAHFVRTDLHLSEIGGKLDVVNEYGTTHLVPGGADAASAHRVVTHSGAIHLEGPAEAIRALPLYAFTQCGRLHTNLPREVLEPLDFGTGDPQRGWHGFVTPSQERFDSSRLERPTAILENSDRTPGIDLISHAGSITILATDGGE